MNYITSAIIFFFVLYCCSDSFVTALSSAKQKIIEEHIRQRRGEQEKIVKAKSNGNSWNINTPTTQAIHTGTEERCIEGALLEMKTQLPTVRTGDTSGVLCDLRPQNGVWSRKKHWTLRPQDWLWSRKRHYTLYMQAPEPLTNEWILHVVHDDRKTEEFYKDAYLEKLQTILRDPSVVTEQNAEATVTIAFTRYEDYPFEVRNFLEAGQIGVYINWIVSLTNELHDHGCSMNNVRATIKTMDDRMRDEALSTYQKALPSTFPDPHLDSDC